ncbi:growth factor receptor-bound protein 2-like [Babylonia areolata]|uniref:growth factor receptor-bound protein 2-like n=1 Tax=Babylonia areolata TaxID=304850 RepID=UPI003FD40750
MEARALYPFDATQDDELSFKRDDTIKVKNVEDKNWFNAELHGKTGFIPSTYIQMEKHDWYQGKMSRTEAEGLLMRKQKTGQCMYQDGAFVVRDCESDKNQFSLSVKHGSGTQHFKILSSAEGKYYLWPNKTFPSINKLIDHHRTVSVAREPRVTILLKDLEEASTSDTLFEALYDFTKGSSDEVSFQRGDHIRLVRKTDENWWTGVVLSSNQEGLFPHNYVREIRH